MRAADLSLARSRAYALFGHLYRDGVTPEVLPEVRALAALNDTLGEPFDAEQAAADHYDLFHLNVFPYASLFLDASGRLGGPVTDDARRRLRQSGYNADTASESADHIGHALGLLAFLSGAEADAWHNDLPAEAERMRRRQRRVLDAYLLWWLPAFAEAVRLQHHPFYSRLSTLTLDLMIDHRRALGRAENPTPTASPLPVPPPLLDDEKTGLRDIAGYLATPPWSGLYLSRADLRRLGRAERVPQGFGPRAQMLANLLRAAATFDRLDSLLNRFAEMIQTWRSHYTTLAENDLPTLETVAQTWLERLDATETIITRMRTAVDL